MDIDPLLTSDRYDVMDWLRDIRGPDRAKALRALLTDECPEYPATRPDLHKHCRVCGGRGWLPKDGSALRRVCVTHAYYPMNPHPQWKVCELKLEFNQEGDCDPQWILATPIAWLEAEDE